MDTIMEDAGLLLAYTLGRLFEKANLLYEYYGITGIIVVCIFLFGVYRFLLYPILGGSVRAGGSDKAQRDVHKDKKETSDG